MAQELLRSGINVAGGVPWGTHFCHFYETKQDLLDTLVPYFKAGLESNEFCVWVVSTPELITVAEAKGALAQAVPDFDRHPTDQNIEILNGPDWYLEENVFNLERVTNAWDAKLKRALALGYDGMRVSVDTFWLAEKDWKDFFAYEKQLNESIIDHPMTVLCTYPLAKSGAAEVLDGVQAHQFATARRQGEWEVIETPELIQAKAEIRRLNRELEQRVIERTGQLAKAIEELTDEISDRKQLRLVLDTTPALIHTGRPDGYLDYFNQRWLKYVGRSLEELQGWGWTASIHPDDVEGIVNEWRASLVSGEPFQDEARVRQADGEYRWMLHRKVPLRDEHGNIVKWHGSSIDIEDRKQTEDALDERLRFETLVTELSAAFANLSPNEVDREIDKWLQTLVEFLGVDRASFFHFGEDWTTLYLSHSYTVPGIEPLSLPPIGINEQFPWITDQLRRGNTIKWSRIPDDLPEQAAKEKKHAATTGAKSVLNIPVLVGGSVICTISFTSIGIYCDWPDATVARLRLVGEIFAAVVERKRADAALRKSEEQFRQLAENIREVFWLATADLSKMLYISPAYEAVWGRSRESLYLEPRSFFVAIHDDDRSHVIAIIERDREQGFEVEYRVVQPDGSIRWIRDRGFPIKDEAGRFYRVAGIAEDITDRKQAEEKLKQSENQLAEAQRLAHVGSFDWDLRTNTVTWSDELYRIFGRQPGEINVAGDAMSFIHPEDRDMVWSTVQSSVRNKEPHSFYYRVIRPDDEERIVHTQGRVVNDEDGHPVRVFGATQDVTELKRAEEQLKVVTEQRRALSASLESAREEEGTRIARELHDELGSALTILRWSLDEIDSNLATSAGQGDANPTRRKIAAMTTLVESTLNTVRRISSELRPSMLDDLGLAATIEWHAQQFQARTGISCTCDCSLENAGLGREQSTAVFRILQEALTNILRHAQATRVDVKIEKQNGYFALLVRDNGKGIIEREKLGILGMRERAHLIGAEIQITGSRGKGTVVSVRVPISGSDTVSQ